MINGRADSRASRYTWSFRFIRSFSVMLLTFLPLHLHATCEQNPLLAMDGHLIKAQLDMNDPCQHWYFVHNLLGSEKWDELDTFVSKERSTKVRFAGGGWKLKASYDALSFPFRSEESEPPTDAEWQALVDRLSRWSAARPDSITARVALAKSYLAYAWAARGVEFSDLVKDDAMQLFNQRVDKADDILAQAHRLPAKCPEWYEVALEAARAEGSDMAEQDRLLEAATSFEPLYYYYYQEHAFALLPRWYGEAGDSERFAEQIANRIGGKQGAIIYFEVAVTLDCSACSGIDEPSLFQLMSWERIKQGYAALVELYGTGAYQLNEFARLALNAKDQRLAAELFLEIGEHGVVDAWGSRRVFLEERQRALSLPPDLFEKFDLAATNYGKPGGSAYGKQFDSDFHARLDPVAKSCFDAVKRDDGAFTIFVRVGGKGDIEQAIPWPPTNASSCLLPKLSAQHFAAPPEPSYWTYINVGEVKPPLYIWTGSVLPDIGR